MKKETFLNMIEISKQTEKRCEDFNNGLEGLIRMPFRDGSYNNDATVMFYWPLEAVLEMFKAALMDMGESEEGAEWFIYEGIDQIDSGKGTEIDDGKVYKINSYEDYYNYLMEKKNA